MMYTMTQSPEMRTKFQSLSSDELVIFQATFNLYANSKGFIEANEVHKILTDIGQEITEEETIELLRSVNGTERIGFESFCYLLLDDDDMSTNSVSTPERPSFKRSSSWTSQNTPTHASRALNLSNDFSSDSASIFSSFSSSSSNENSSFSSQTRTMQVKPQKPPIRRETTVYGSQLLKHRSLNENDNMKTFARHSNGLIEIFTTLPKNRDGNVSTKDIKNALLNLGVSPADSSMQELDRRKYMNQKQFQTFFHLNFGR